LSPESGYQVHGFKSGYETLLQPLRNSFLKRPGLGKPGFPRSLLGYLVPDVDFGLQAGGTEGPVNEDQVGRVEPKVQSVVLQDF
jgi:hypothetical protein